MRIKSILHLNHMFIFISFLCPAKTATKPVRTAQLKVIHFEDTNANTKSNEFHIQSTKLLENIAQDKMNISERIPLHLKMTYTTLSKEALQPDSTINLSCKDPGTFTRTNTFMMVNDDGIEYLIHKFNRGLDYIFHMTSSMGFPSITWFPTIPGHYEPDKSALSIRLEPTNYHIVNAIVDLLRAYNWSRVALVVSRTIPEYDRFLKDFRQSQKDRESITHENHFKFRITQHFVVSGVGTDDVPICNQRKTHCSFYMEMIRVLDKLYENDDRVFVFHGSQAEMMFILTYVKSYVTGSKSYLKKLFGANYIWLCTPALMSLVKTQERNKKLNPDIMEIKGSWSIRGVNLAVPGMFVFVTVNNYEAYEAKAKIAMELWVKSLSKLTSKLREYYGKDDKAIAERLLAPDVCRGNSSKWTLGSRLYQIMKSTTLKIDEEYIGFLENGVINTTEMFIFNSKLRNKDMIWRKVGSWSMSSKWGRSKSKLFIDGVTWPGNEIKPPKGRSDKFRLKVATIAEAPFVIYPETQSSVCDANSIKCWIRDTKAPPTKGSDYTTNLKLFNVNVSSDYPYISGCCSGLTIDMLLEFMKDLEFEVDLFDVPDGKWGGWTPEGWNGLVKVLKDKTAHMAVTSFKITPNRSAQIEFSVPFQQTGIAIMVALREGGISPTAFLEPYDYQSWCVILVFSVHACGAALFIYEWLSPHGLDRGNQVNPGHKFSFFRSLWLIWSMLFGAAVNADNPRGTASRFLANIWALFALVFLASYTANLAAFMIAKDDYYNLIGIKDDHLINPMHYKPPFTFATVPSGATEENIKLNFKHMHEYMKKFNKSSVEDGIKSLKSGEINAFIYDSNVLEYRAARDEKCKLRTVGNLFAMTGYGVGFAKDSPYLNKINDRILEYQNNGKLQRWKQYWLTGPCKKGRRLDSTNKRLGVKNFISAFILLLGGIILCSLLLLLEYAFYRYLRPHLTNIDRYGCCGLVSISMGQILSFEQSVNQTVGLMKSHKCSNPICEAKMNKIQNESDRLNDRLKKLEKALMVERLENQRLRDSGLGHFPKTNDRSNKRIQVNSKPRPNAEISVHSVKMIDSNIGITPTFVYECTHPKKPSVSIDKFQLSGLNPSQVYRPNNTMMNTEKSVVLDDNYFDPVGLSRRKHELMEKESSL